MDEITQNIKDEIYNNFVSDIVLMLENYAIIYRKKYINYNTDEIVISIIKLAFMIVCGHSVSKNDMLNFNITDLYIDMNTFCKKLTTIKNPDKDIESQMRYDIFKILKYIYDVRYIINPLCQVFKIKRNELIFGM